MGSGEQKESHQPVGISQMVAAYGVLATDIVKTSLKGQLTRSTVEIRTDVHKCKSKVKADLWTGPGIVSADDGGHSGGGYENSVWSLFLLHLLYT